MGETLVAASGFWPVLWVVHNIAGGSISPPNAEIATPMPLSEYELCLPSRLTAPTAIPKRVLEKPS